VDVEVSYCLVVAIKFLGLAQSKVRGFVVYDKNNWIICPWCSSYSFVSLTVVEENKELAATLRGSRPGVQ